MSLKRVSAAFIFIDGFCIANPVQMVTFKKVFIQVYTPYSLKKGEQANIKLSIFNYNSDGSIRVSEFL